MSETIAIVGSGYMGGGIAQRFALGDHRVVLADVDAAAAEAAKDRLTTEAERFEQQGLFPHGAAVKVRSALTAAASIEDAAGKAALVVGAVPEKSDIKAAVYQRIFATLPSDGIVASNTSALSIRDLAAHVPAPHRFLGVHCMNPAPFIPGVEIVPGPDTADDVIAKVQRLITSIGKESARVPDVRGFVANRLQHAMFSEAGRMIDAGLVSPEDLDTIVRNTFGFRLALLGPFLIADMSGLDVYEDAYATFERAYGDRYRLPDVIRARSPRATSGRSMYTACSGSPTTARRRSSHGGTAPTPGSSHGGTAPTPGSPRSSRSSAPPQVSEPAAATGSIARITSHVVTS